MKQALSAHTDSMLASTTGSTPSKAESVISADELAVLLNVWQWITTIILVAFVAFCAVCATSIWAIYEMTQLLIREL